MRGAKGILYEEGVRVLAIVSFVCEVQREIPESATCSECSDMAWT